MRRVYAAVRDVDWDTVPAAISGLEVNERRRRVPRRVRRPHAPAARSISPGTGRSPGTRDGRVEFVFDGRAEHALPVQPDRDLRPSPLAGDGGRAVHRAIHPTASMEGAFPDLIGAQAFVDGSVPRHSSPPLTGSRSSSRRVEGSCSSSRVTCGRSRIIATGQTRTSRRTRHRSASAVRRRSRRGRGSVSAS